MERIRSQTYLKFKEYDTFETFSKCVKLQRVSTMKDEFRKKICKNVRINYEIIRQIVRIT